MPPSQVNIFDLSLVLGTLKAAILLVLIMYAIFAMIIIRQVDLMSKTLITHVSPTLKLLSIIHAVLALGLIVLAWGIL